ncbi:MAG: AI-2E family transporter [Balneolales bacterium]
MPSNRENNALPASTVARYTLVVVAILAAALFFWQIKDALLIALGGVIVAVVLSGMARGLRSVLPLSRGWSLAGAGLEVILVIGMLVLIFGSQIADEFQQLTEKLPQQVQQVRQSMQNWPMSEYLLNGEGDGNGGQGGSGGQENSGGQDEGEGQGSGGGQNGEEGQNGGMQGTGGMLLQAGATLTDVLATLLLVIFVGIFFAVNPELYKNGILLLVTPDRTERVDEALEASGKALWKWLMGQLIAMTFVGVAVAVGLTIAGVPLALILGLIAGLFDFVPYVGPIVAIIPGMLLAFAEGPQTALWAGVVYLIVQQLEGYVITPLIQRQKISLPPGIIILAVVAFGLVFGVPGIVLATPLAVITMVLLGMLYVQDVLGKEVEIPGQD